MGLFPRQQALEVDELERGRVGKVEREEVGGIEFKHSPGKATYGRATDTVLEHELTGVRHLISPLP